MIKLKPLRLRDIVDVDEAMRSEPVNVLLLLDVVGSIVEDWDFVDRDTGEAIPLPTEDEPDSILDLTDEQFLEIQEAVVTRLSIPKRNAGSSIPTSKPSKMAEPRQPRRGGSDTSS